MAGSDTLFVAMQQLNAAVIVATWLLLLQCAAAGLTNSRPFFCFQPARDKFVFGQPSFRLNSRVSIPRRYLGHEEVEDPDQVLALSVRPCTHAELGACADIIIHSFYNYTSLSPWRQMTRLAELNRIQQGFPYGNDRSLHQMMIAVAGSDSRGSRRSSETICGFVDVDARIPNQPTSYSYNPRPYLSDLCIHPDFRRRGIATLLIQACEQFCVNLPRHRWSDQSSDSELAELYIRVEATNAAAIDMYEKLGYKAVPNPDGDNILILHKILKEPGNPTIEQRQDRSCSNVIHQV
jgi:ribosomal protein S18 acetylase RimI-like enzyme